MDATVYDEEQSSDVTIQVEDFQSWEAFTYDLITLVEHLNRDFKHQLEEMRVEVEELHEKLVDESFNSPRVNRVSGRKRSRRTDH